MSAHNEEGMVPINEFDCNSRVTRFVSRDNPEGIEPVNELLFNFNDFIEVRFPKDPEIVPMSP